MATPRSEIYDATKPVTCHCISRCVRRTHLLAPEERRQALSDRLAQLAHIFAIDVLEWSLLSNHFHLVAATHPDLASLWSDEEVARRWRTLSPDYQWRRRNRIDRRLPAQQEEIDEALLDPELIERWRANLADLSTFHKFLKQKIARIINMDDEVGGHCFEGRFKSIVATDEDAVIAHMVYVALNPVRAGLADSLDSYKLASIEGRVKELRRRITAGEFAGEAEAARRNLQAVTVLPALPCDPGDDAIKPKTLPDGRPNPWFGGRRPSLLRGSGSIGLVSYLGQVDSVGRMKRADKPGAIPDSTPSPLEMLQPLFAQSDGEQTTITIDDRTRARSMIDDVESAMPRGLANPIGNFSGCVDALARVALDSGRQFIVGIAGPLGRGRRCAAAEEDPDGDSTRGDSQRPESS